MPNCLHAMHQYGNVPLLYADTQPMELPATLVDMCEGDFLGSDTADSRLVAKLISLDVAWDTNLATTLLAAKLAFQGVNLVQVDDDSCATRPNTTTIARYRAGSTFTRAYEIVDAAGAAAPTTWVRGQGFTFAKNPASNALVDSKIVKSSVAGEIVFRAVKDSGPDNVAYAEVEFAA